MLSTKSSVEGGAHRDRLLEQLGLDKPGPDPEFDGLARLAVAATGSRAAFIGFWGAGKLKVRACEGVDPDAQAHVEALGQQCLQIDAMAAGPRLLVARQTDQETEKNGALPFATYAEHPIQFEGATLGIIGVFDQEPHESDARRHGALTDLASMASALLQQRSQSLRLEDALKLSEERYRLLWQVTTDVVLLVDECNVIQFANPAIEAMFGHPPAEVLGRDLCIVQPERLVRPHREGFARYLASGRKSVDWHAFETVGLHRDGSEFPIEIAYGVMQTGGRRLFAAFIRNITSRKLQAKALERSEARFRALTALSSDWYWETDSSCRLTKIFGGSAGSQALELQSLIGQVPWEAEETTADPADVQIQSRLTQSKRSFRDLEFAYHGSDGAQFVSISGEPVFDDSGQFVGYRGVGRDLTRQRRADEERRALESQWRESQKIESIGALAGGIAHDFNNVLAGILGNAAMALQDVGSQHSAAASLQQILKAGSHGRHLVRQILAFSRRQPTELVPCHLQVRVKETLGLLRAVLPAGLKIQTALTERPLWISADATQIDQVLLNLCTNAWHALKDNAGSIVIGLDSVELTGREPSAPGQHLAAGSYADLWVSDTGCGMSGDTLDQIFEPFFTTKAGGQGTGLGLAVVRGIVQAHHGAVFVQSELGLGTTFHVRIPLIETYVASSAPRDDVATSRGTGEHVLYVDDDDVVVLMVERLLRRLGYRVTCCTNGQEAIDRLRESPGAFDAVVTDLNMPNMSGLDLAREAIKIRGDLPILVSSGNLPESLEAEARRIGVRMVLDKANTVESLGPALRNLLSVPTAA